MKFGMVIIFVSSLIVLMGEALRSYTQTEHQALQVRQGNPNLLPRDVADALANDIFPQSSDACTNGSPVTTSQYGYPGVTTPGSWDPRFESMEGDMFLAQLNHDDDNVNKSWSIRIGQGGNIYSYTGAYGEAMPPQHHTDAPWIDEVWQMVAVNLGQNTPSDPYFIHQAGSYTREDELKEKPFWSPSLASSCSTAHECSFLSWGQQAHVPTKHKSGVLYYNRYRDCGDGTLEITYIIHNAAAITDEDSKLDYFNVPWAGTRASVLSDMVMSKEDGSGLQQDPIVLQGWGIAQVKPLPSLGGYTTFAEGLPKTFEMPCGNSAGNLVSCDVFDAQRLKLKLAKPCQYVKFHNPPSFRFKVSTAQQIRQGVNTKLVMKSPRGDSLRLRSVKHWNWAKKWFYFYPEDASYTAKTCNDQFKVGDVLQFSAGGKHEEDNLALSFVHGRDAEYPRAGFRAPSRVRYGTSSRDFNVFTVNVFPPEVGPGSTYFNRQYMTTGRFAEAHNDASKWVDSATHGMLAPASPPGRPVHIYSQDELEFSITLADSPPCGDTRCSGFTTPRSGFRALYYIRCGENVTMFTSDLNALSPTGSMERSYQCDGMPLVRPAWTMLGFFAEGACSELERSKYSRDTCEGF